MGVLILHLLVSEINNTLLSKFKLQRKRGKIHKRRPGKKVLSHFMAYSDLDIYKKPCIFVVTCNFFFKVKLATFVGH